MIDRNIFVSEELQDSVHIDSAHSMPGGDYSISQTAVVDHMVQRLRVEPGMRVLDIGSGTGYHAARLAEMGAQVIGVEALPHAVEGALRNLEQANVSDVKIHQGDGMKGEPSSAPFDRINVACALSAFPVVLFEQLRPGGLILYPASIPGISPGERPDILLLIEKHGELAYPSDRQGVDRAMTITQLNYVYFMRCASDSLPTSLDRTDFSFGAEFDVLRSGTAYDVSRARPEIGFVELRHQINEGPPLHYHRYEDEKFRVQNGAFEFFIGEERLEVKKGESCFAPRNTPHRYRATENNSELFITVTPGGAERYFPESANYWKQPDANFDGSAEINARYGMILMESSADRGKINKR